MSTFGSVMRVARVCRVLTKRSVSIHGNKRTRHFSRLTVSRMCRLKSAESIAHDGAIPRRRFDSSQMFSPIVVPVKQTAAYASGLDTPPRRDAARLVAQGPTRCCTHSPVMFVMSPSLVLASCTVGSELLRPSPNSPNLSDSIMVMLVGARPSPPWAG